jgi:glyoxylase-like metal-dependent hydrolase (beta-lactamase superfamily II)/ferredoxin
MADQAKRLSTNIDGNFFVDSTCINCDTCRQLAPKSFVENGEYSSVYQQPGTESERFQSFQALLACPVGSIGAIVPDKAMMRAATESFPLKIEREGARLAGKEPVLAGSGLGKAEAVLAALGREGDIAGATTPAATGKGPVSAGPGRAGAMGGCEREVYYNGFNSEKSFGANSYFVRHPDGNWLIDSPRYINKLVKAFEGMGGIKYIFLTHEDDVAEASRYAKQFGAIRIIHREDMAALPDAEWIIEGSQPVEFKPEFLIIPVPGHTRGSMALLYGNRYLFTGDHMGWDREVNGLRLATVYVWDEPALRRSTERLLDYAFEWVLPGHSDRMYLPADRMKEELRLLLKRRAEKL